MLDSTAIDVQGNLAAFQNWTMFESEQELIDYLFGRFFIEYCRTVIESLFFDLLKSLTS